MARKLVIVESPGKIRTIAHVLGRGWLVKASVGHVRDIRTTGPKGVRKNRAEIVNGVSADFTPNYVELPRKRKVIEELRKAAEGAEAVYLCPDPDREGEAIAWHLKEVLRLDPEGTLRVTFNEITPRGIQAGFANPRRINMHLVNAQQARRVLDRIVGFKLTPLLWQRVAQGLTAGRVQSVAVHLVAEREREIAAFHPEGYWTVSARLAAVGADAASGGAEFPAELRELDGKAVAVKAEDLEKARAGERLLLASEAEARAVAEAVRASRLRVRSYEVREEERRPYPPFTTSLLQRAAANRLGFGAKRTMGIAQQLYQGVPIGGRGQVGLITYMRTDAYRIAQDALEECRQLIATRFGTTHLPESPNFYRAKEGAQAAHECIRPTHVEITPDDARQVLPPEQWKLYKLIWERFVACQMRPAVYGASSVELVAEGPAARGAVLRATGRNLRFDGWLAAQAGAAQAEATQAGAAEDDRAEEAGLKTLPALREGDAVEVLGVDPERHETQPPPRYTEAALVKKLEDEGIGRPSTYAEILSKIQERGYVEKRGGGGRGALAATALGMEVNSRLERFFSRTILDVGFTRRMEEELDRIEERESNWRKVLEDIDAPFEADFARAVKGMPTTRAKGQPSEQPCPGCDASMERWITSQGVYLRCPADGCGRKLQVDAVGRVVEDRGHEPTGLACDLCAAEVVRATGRFGVYLHCVKRPDCRFTMRLSKQGLPVRKFAPEPAGRDCARCGKPLVLRVSARGRRGPRAFLSCSGFPKCREAADLPPELAEAGTKALVRWKADRGKDLADQARYRPPEGEA